MASGATCGGSSPSKGTIFNQSRPYGQHGKGLRSEYQRIAAKMPFIMDEENLLKCYNCNKDISIGFETCPHCGVPVRYSKIDEIKKATNLHTEGNVMVSRGKYREAVEFFRQAIELFPEYGVAYYNLGLAYISLKEYSNAIDSLSDAIRLKPNFAAAYTSRGDAYLALGEVEQAIADYSMAIELYPDYARAYYKRAQAHIINEDVYHAREDLTDYLTYKPHDAVAKRKLENLGK